MVSIIAIKHLILFNINYLFAQSEDLVLWHINQCRLFDTKFSLYIYIEDMINVFKWDWAPFFQLNGFIYI